MDPDQTAPKEGRIEQKGVFERNRNGKIQIMMYNRTVLLGYLPFGGTVYGIQCFCKRTRKAELRCIV